MIQSMVQWDHATEWSVADFSDMVNTRQNYDRVAVADVHQIFAWTLQGSSKTGESVIEIDTTKEEHAFFLGHTIDGRVLFPATGYLVSFGKLNTWFRILCSGFLTIIFRIDIGMADFREHPR